MALLNPPELRPSVMVVITRFLATRRGQRDQLERLVGTLAPACLQGASSDLDVRANLTVATELGLFTRAGDEVCLAEGVAKVAQLGDGAIVNHLRARVFCDEVNTAPWGSQVGARDLTNGLSWFLTFAPSESPIQMEGHERSAKDLQERDFGPRQASEDDDEAGGWPIGNPTRWNSFRRWSCSLGFSWVSPRGHLVPDPTRAIRDVLPEAIGGSSELSAQEFIDKLSAALPVLDGGRYRVHVEANWRRGESDQSRLSAPLSDALERLRGTRELHFDDRADASRVTRHDGSTFSHVRTGRRP